MCDVGGPAFKTQKLLGGRALVSDAFGRGHSQSFSSLYTTAQAEWGDGWYSHREGYNVLYGDWHAKWYGDPKQRYIWWPEITPTDAAYQTSINILANTQRSGIAWFQPEDGGSWTLQYDAIRDSGTYAWHVLDTAANVDVGTEDGVSWDD